MMLRSWPIPVHLHPDELLSSYLIRAAMRHGCDPIALTSLVWPRTRPWTFDLDYQLSEDRSLSLSRVSAVPIDRLERATLSSAVSRIERKASRNRAWILAIGSRNRRRTAGLQYCPACLEADETPYFRRQWRLAWHTACDVHLRLLHDTCPSCDASLEPHRIGVIDGDPTACAKCAASLSSAPEVPPDSLAHSFQSIADFVVANGWGRIGSHVVPAAEWFSLAHYFLSFTRQASFLRPGAYRQFAETIRLPIWKLARSRTALPFELLPVDERARYLAVTARLMILCPRVVLKAAQTAGLTQAAFLGLARDQPRHIRWLTRQLPATNYRRVNSRVPSGKPKSAKAVATMFARLQRRSRAKASTEKAMIGAPGDAKASRVHG